MVYKPKQQIGVGWIDFQKEEREYVQQIMDTGRLSYGKFTQRFEKEFAKAHQVKYAAFCNSGTSALQAGLNALKIKYHYNDGDYVIVPSVTFVASVNVILQNGLRPLFVDVDRNYYELDPIALENVLQSSTFIGGRIRAIMPVHVGGLPCDMSWIKRIADKYELQIIEDSCETMFTSQNGQSVGSFGEVSCFSTYVAHILTTGVGGIACTNDPELAELIRSLFNHGRDSIYLKIDDDKDKHGEELKKIISKRFKFEHVGYSYRATEFEAALGLAQLHRAKKNIRTRRRNAERLTKGLSRLEVYLQLPTSRMNAKHAYMFYPIVMRGGQDREKFVNYLEERLIETRYLLPLIDQPVYRKLFGNIEPRFPNAYWLNRSAFYIGCHPGLTDKDIDYIIKVFYDYFK